MRHLPIIPPSRYTLGFLYLVAIAFTGFFIYLYVESVRSLAPNKAGAQLSGLLFMLGLLALAFGGIWFALHRRVLLLTEHELTLRAGFYGRTLRRSALRPDSALELSLVDRVDLAPRWRTNGIGLPGFRAGWFRLRNNERALVLLTDPFHVTYLPTTEGYVLLVSTTALLPALHEHDPPAAP